MVNGYRTVLRRAGTVLVLVGAADITLMIYCLVHGLSYSSSLNVFAVIGGIFLIGGSLQAARIVAWFAAFVITGSAGAALVLLPLARPADLWATQLRLDPAGTLLPLLAAFAAMALLYWVYRQLRSPVVLEARAAAGQATAPPKGAFVLGALLVLVLAGSMHFMLGGEAAKKAVQLARGKLGSSYKYNVTALQQSGRHYRANVTAYNRVEIRAVEVEWRQ